MMRSPFRQMSDHLKRSTRDIHDRHSRRAKLGASVYVQPCGSSTQSTIGDKLRDWALLLYILTSIHYAKSHLSITSSLLLIVFESRLELDYPDMPERKPSS
jgi:hypothetical protein